MPGVVQTSQLGTAWSVERHQTAVTSDDSEVALISLSRVECPKSMSCEPALPRTCTETAVANNSGPQHFDCPSLRDFI